jgi:hypothetical protein
MVLLLARKDLGKMKVQGKLFYSASLVVSVAVSCGTEFEEREQTK